MISQVLLEPLTPMTTRKKNIIYIYIIRKEIKEA